NPRSTCATRRFHGTQEQQSYSSQLIVPANAGTQLFVLARNHPWCAFQPASMPPPHAAVAAFDPSVAVSWRRKGPKGRVQGCTCRFASIGSAVDHPGSSSRTRRSRARTRGVLLFAYISLGQARESRSLARRDSESSKTHHAETVGSAGSPTREA